MRDQHLRLRVLDDVHHLVRPAVPVDRHAVGTHCGRGLLHLEESEVVAQQQGDRVAFVHAELLEACRGLSSDAQHLFARNAAAVEVNHRDHRIPMHISAPPATPHARRRRRTTGP
jgi:hypothetical protein